MNIKVGTFDYKLSETNTPILLDHQECGGIIDFEQMTIDIKKDMNIQIKKVTYLHEIFHAILHNYNIDIGDLDEEELVEKLGTALFQIIKDNTKLIEYIGGN